MVSLVNAACLNRPSAAEALLFSAFSQHRDTRLQLCTAQHVCKGLAKGEETPTEHSRWYSPALNTKSSQKGFRDAESPPAHHINKKAKEKPPCGSHRHVFIFRPRAVHHRWAGEEDSGRGNPRAQQSVQEAQSQTSRGTSMCSLDAISYPQHNISLFALLAVLSYSVTMATSWSSGTCFLSSPSRCATPDTIVPVWSRCTVIQMQTLALEMSMLTQQACAGVQSRWCLLPLEVSKRGTGKLASSFPFYRLANWGEATSSWSHWPMPLQEIKRTAPSSHFSRSHHLLWYVDPLDQAGSVLCLFFVTTSVLLPNKNSTFK